MSLRSVRYLQIPQRRSWRDQRRTTGAFDIRVKPLLLLGNVLYLQKKKTDKQKYCFYELRPQNFSGAPVSLNNHDKIIFARIRHGPIRKKLKFGGALL